MQIIKFTKGAYLPLFVLCTLGLQVISLFWNAVDARANYLDSIKEPPSLVQLEDGRAVPVKPVDRKERTPETIDLFVGDTLTLLFNRSGTLPVEKEGDKPKKDPGIRLKGKTGTISTASELASLAFAKDFRQPLLEKVAELQPNTGERLVLAIRDKSTPTPIGYGRWKVVVIGELVYFTEDNRIIDSIPFNKEVYLRSVNKQHNPLGKSATVLERTVAQILQAGLLIDAIREYQRPNL